MIRKEQDKILDAKIESNVDQYKADRLDAEISAFSSVDLNKYEFLTRKDLKYKPNALDKVRFEFSPLGQTFSTRLDKTGLNYQEEGVIKLLKDIRDHLASDNRPNDDGNDDNRSNDDGNDDNRPNDDGNDDNRPNDDGNDDIKRKLNASITEYNNLLLEYNRMAEDMKKTKDELNIAKNNANNYKQEAQYLKNDVNDYKQKVQHFKKNSTSRKRSDQAKSITDQRKKTP